MEALEEMSDVCYINANMGKTIFMRNSKMLSNYVYS